MLLSIIIPVYNVEKYLAECLDSVCSQTLKDLEIICIDDGSTDNSAAILADYARRDPRIRVIKQANAGVGAARNRGMDEARGKYVAFVDADDYLDLRMAEDTVALCEKNDLDFCLFDFICFDYKTREEMVNSWSIVNHPEIPQERVFAPWELTSWGFSCAIWSGVFRRSFLVAQKIRFSELKLGEDFCVFFSLLSQADRVYVNPKIFYHYRRGTPSSAMSRLSRDAKGQDAKESQVLFVKACASLLDDCSARLPLPAFTALLRRCYHEAFYYAERNPSVIALLRGECRRSFRADEQTPQSLGEEDYDKYVWPLLSLSGKLRNPSALVRRISKCFHDEGPWYTLKRMFAFGVGGPKKLRDHEKVLRCLRQIEEARQNTAPDLYLVTGQVNSKTNEPIDSWTFFTWLQDHDIPSRYLTWREHVFYKKLVREGKTKDVVALKGDGFSDHEILYRHSGLLVRAKALVQENTALDSVLWKWIVNLPNCERVFLDHGVMFWKCEAALFCSFAECNSVNVSSGREKELLEKNVVVNPNVGVLPRFFVAGLPRFDLLKDERDPNRSEFVLFVMFTWRKSFGDNLERIKTSVYCQHICEFLRSENLKRLKRSRVRIVASIHHHIANRIPDFTLGDGVEISPTDKVSYWIRHADACLTDYSSVSFDFAFLHKPTIFWIPDVGDPTLNECDRGEIEAACQQSKDFYNMVKSEEDALHLIESYAKNNFVLESEKCAIADTFFAYKKDVCQHVYEGVEEIIKERRKCEARGQNELSLGTDPCRICAIP